MGADAFEANNPEAEETFMTGGGVVNPGYPFRRDNIFIQVTEDLYIGDHREISIICDVSQMSD